MTTETKPAQAMPSLAELNGRLEALSLQRNFLMNEHVRLGGALSHALTELEQLRQSSAAELESLRKRIAELEPKAG